MKTKPKKKLTRRPTKGARPPLPEQVTFHYIKSNQFRVIRADGVQGGVTPRGNAVQIGIFSERQPIPLQCTHALSRDGAVGKEVSRAGREGIVREVEVEMIASLEDAESIAKWILEKVNQARGLRGRGGKK